MNKSSILDKIIAQEESFVQELSSSLSAFQNASDMDEEETKDLHDMSQANEAKDMQLRLQVQYDKAVSDLKHLKETSRNPQQTAIAGALVETDHAFYLLGASIHNIEVEGKTVYGISANSPGFAEVYGKETGDSISLGDSKHTIITIG